MSRDYDFIVVGAGIFGLTAALELERRGHRVTVLDPGPVPHPLAATRTSNLASSLVSPARLNR